MKYILLFITFSILLFSCQKEINIDLNTTNPKTVIEANYTAEDSTVHVKVTQTSNYFDGNSSPTIDGAAISITDKNGLSQPIIGLGNGEYELSNYVPIFNSTYTLSVVLNGTTYTAKSTLSSPTPLKDINYEFVPGFFGIEGGHVCYLNYDDPIDTTNFFFALISKNGIQRNQVNDFTLTDDRLTDGNSISRPLFGPDNLFEIGDTIEFELRAVDESIFSYYIELQSIAGGNGGQSAAPANPKSNWNNEALGYFNAYSNSRKSVIIL